MNVPYYRVTHQYRNLTSSVNSPIGKCSVPRPLFSLTKAPFRRTNTYLDEQETKTLETETRKEKERINIRPERAEKTVEAHAKISLNMKNYREFFDALAGPVQFNSELISALEEHERRVSPSN